jgi:alkanesulfonate monooxygenase SsuD/methylene tetrahydromethanopterin reductase-like flavin-dependent oxidoreductase (luciferase family)
VTTIRFAVSAGARYPEPERLRSLVTGAEEAGIDTLWFSDLTTLPSTDPLLSMAMAAAWTTRVKLGTTIVPFGYEPFVFARQVAQLDLLSQGRVRVMLVTGLEQPGERQALGIVGVHRGRALDELIGVLRALWAGEPLPGGGPALATRPHQEHLQIWLAGKSDQALQRVGRLGDGWRGGGLSPVDAGRAVARINEVAEAAGRTIDPGHFGITITYARDAADLERATRIHGEAVAARDPLVRPVGRDELRRVVDGLVGVGLSKFSLRRASEVVDWDDELAWLAKSVLELQT